MIIPAINTATYSAGHDFVSLPFVDLRGLTPGERRPHILRMLGLLRDGAEMELVMDQDPFALHRQLEWIYPATYSFAYVQKGPDLWRVRVGKLAGCGDECRDSSH